LLLQETKLREDCVLQDSKPFWKPSTGKEISSRGASGGICTLWNSQRFILADFQQSQHWFLTKLWNNTSRKSVSIINVYVPNLYQEKLDCWRSLFNIVEDYSNNEVILSCDFNTTLYPWENKGGSLVQDPERENLENLISFFDLIYLKSGKGNYTWSNRRLGHISARLDHFLVRNSLLLDSASPSLDIFP
jgi:exonuclease III